MHENYGELFSARLYSGLQKSQHLKRILRSRFSIFEAKRMRIRNPLHKHWISHSWHWCWLGFSQSLFVRKFALLRATRQGQKWTFACQRSLWVARWRENGTCFCRTESCCNVCKNKPPPQTMLLSSFWENACFCAYSCLSFSKPNDSNIDVSLNCVSFYFSIKRVLDRHA